MPYIEAARRTDLVQSQKPNSSGADEDEAAEFIDATDAEVAWLQ